MESRRNFLKGLTAVATLGGLESTLAGCAIRYGFDKRGFEVSFEYPGISSKNPSLERIDEERIDPLKLDLLRKYQAYYKARVGEHYSSAGLEHLQPDEFIVSEEVMEAFEETRGLKKRKDDLKTLGIYFKSPPSPTQRREFNRIVQNLRIQFYERIVLQTLFNLSNKKIVYQSQIFLDGYYCIVMPHERAHRYMDQSLSEAEHQILEEGYEEMKKITLAVENIFLGRSDYALKNYNEFYATLTEGLLPQAEVALKETNRRAYTIFEKIKKASKL